MDVTGIRRSSQVGARTEHRRSSAVADDEGTAVLGSERANKGEARVREDNREHTGRVIADQVSPRRWPSKAVGDITSPGITDKEWAT
jgi:hypothetical protein